MVHEALHEHEPSQAAKDDRLTGSATNPKPKVLMILDTTFGEDRGSESIFRLLYQGFQVLFPWADGKLKTITRLDEIGNIKTNKRAGYNFVALKSQGPLSQRFLSLC